VGISVAAPITSGATVLRSGHPKRKSHMKKKYAETAPPAPTHARLVHSILAEMVSERISWKAQNVHQAMLNPEITNQV
jgi:hypothetical protein